jgi:hypothetical protein
VRNERRHDRHVRNERRHDRHVRNERRHVRNGRRHVAIGIEEARTLVILHIGVLVRIEAMYIVALVLLMLRDVGEGHVNVDRHRRKQRDWEESLIIEVAA